MKKKDEIEPQLIRKESMNYSESKLEAIKLLLLQGGEEEEKITENNGVCMSQELNHIYIHLQEQCLHPTAFAGLERKSKRPRKKIHPSIFRQKEAENSALFYLLCTLKWID